MAASPVKPMLANGIEIDNMGAKGINTWNMEPKIDGWRCIVQVTDGEVELFSRTGKSFTEKVTPELLDQFRHVGLNYRMDGELAFFKDMTMLVSDYPATASVLGSNPDTALWKQRQIYDVTGQQLTFVGFDFLQAAGSDLSGLPQGERTRILRTVLYDTWKTAPTPQLLFAPMHEGFDDSIYQSIVLAGGEGVVLKNPDAYYQYGKRPANHWYKLKKFETLDVIIVGYKEGEGKYAGQIGSLEFALWILDEEGNPVGRKTMGYCSGMDDALRHHMTVNFDHDYVGRVMEIRHFGQVGKDQEGFRHPQFIRLRPDKDWMECTIGR